MLGLNDDESLFGDAFLLSCFLLFLQVCWELTQVRAAGLLLLVIVVWCWWQPEPGLRARGSQEPQVRLCPLRHMDNGQGGLPLWTPSFPPWDSVGVRDGTQRPQSRCGARVPKGTEVCPEYECFLPGTGFSPRKSFGIGA